MHFFLYPMMFFMAIVIGALHVATPFGLLLLLPVLAMIAGALAARTMKNRSMFAMLGFASCLGSWLSLVVLFLSSLALPVGHARYYYWNSLPSVARAGLPFAVVEIPPPPLGNDAPPQAMWLGILANHVFWLAVGILIASIVIRKNKKAGENISKPAEFAVAASIALIAVLSQIGLLVFWFD